MTIPLPHWAAWLQALAPAFAVLVSAFAVSVSVLTFRLGRQLAQWQAAVAREQLRQNLYDRRFAIYMAFHELLVAIAEKDDADAELRKANIARAHSPFLLNARLGTYLEKLHAEAFRIDRTTKIVRDKSLPQDRATIAQLGHTRLAFTNRIGELIEEFQPFLRLKDLSPTG